MRSLIKELLKPCSILLVPIIVFLIIPFPILLQNASWNNKAIKTDCLIVDYLVTNSDYTSWVGSVQLIWESKYTDFISVIKTSSYIESLSYLVVNYPLNSTIDCYYQPDDLYNIDFRLKSYGIVDPFSVIFGIIFIFALVIMIHLQCEAYAKYKKFLDEPVILNEPVIVESKTSDNSSNEPKISNEPKTSNSSPVIVELKTLDNSSSYEPKTSNNSKDEESQ